MPTNTDDALFSQAAFDPSPYSVHLDDFVTDSGQLVPGATAELNSVSVVGGNWAFALGGQYLEVRDATFGSALPSTRTELRLTGDHGSFYLLNDVTLRGNSILTFDHQGIAEHNLIVAPIPSVSLTEVKVDNLGGWAGRIRLGVPDTGFQPGDYTSELARLTISGPGGSSQIHQLTVGAGISGEFVVSDGATPRVGHLLVGDLNAGPDSYGTVDISGPQTTLTLTEGSRIDQGVLRISEGATLRNTGVGPIWAGTDSQVEVLNGSVLDASYLGLSLDGDVLIEGPGSTVRLSNHESGGGGIGSGNITIRNSGHLVASTPSRPMSFSGTMDIAEASAQLGDTTISGKVSVNDGALTGRTMRVKSGGLVEILSGTNVSGTFRIEEEGTVRLSGPSTYASGDSVTVAGGLFESTDAAKADVTAIRIIEGSMALRSGSRLESHIVGLEGGLLTQEGGSHLEAEELSVLGGLLSIVEESEMALGSAWLAAGEIAVGPGSRVHVSERLDLDGGSIGLSDPQSLVIGATGSTSAAGVAVGLGGTLELSGTVELLGNTGIDNFAGSLLVGAPAELPGDYEQGSTADLRINWDPRDPSQLVDAIMTLLGTASLDGTLEIVGPADRLELPIGTQVVLLEAAGILGDFRTIIDRTNYAMEVETIGSTVVMTTTQIPEPTTAILLGLGLISLGSRSRPRAAR